ncbi:RND3 (predicted) [Pycnogonum litorale]
MNLSTSSSGTRQWFPEVVKYCPGVPVLLCGCQSDKRAEVGRSNDIQISLDDKGYCDESIGVSLEEALSISRRISAVTYVETSAKLSLNSVSEAFEMAALAAMGRLNRKHSGVERPLPLTKYETTLKEQKRKSCCIM